MVLSYLVRAKAGMVDQCESSFISINLFYVLGSLGEILSLNSIESQAIYSMMEDPNPVSYHLSLFEYFAHLSLANPTDHTLCKFAIDSLDFLHIDEVKNLKIFIQIYSQIEMLFLMMIKLTIKLAIPDSLKI